MRSIEERLLELVADVHLLPLYAAYRWWLSDTGEQRPITAFLDLIALLLESDNLRLLQVAEPGDEAIEHFEVPASLGSEYERSGHDDKTYDPFGYLLALGPGAAALEGKPWRLAIDFSEGTFELTSRASALDEAISALTQQLAQGFEIVERSEGDDTVRIWGTIGRNK